MIDISLQKPSDDVPQGMFGKVATRAVDSELSSEEKVSPRQCEEQETGGEIEKKFLTSPSFLAVGLVFLKFCVLNLC